MAAPLLHAREAEVQWPATRARLVRAEGELLLACRGTGITRHAKGCSLGDGPLEQAWSSREYYRTQGCASTVLLFMPISADRLRSSA